jgi:hypothetical protein
VHYNFLQIEVSSRTNLSGNGTLTETIGIQAPDIYQSVPTSSGNSDPIYCCLGLNVMKLMTTLRKVLLVLGIYIYTKFDRRTVLVGGK